MTQGSVSLDTIIYDYSNGKGSFTDWSRSTDVSKITIPVAASNDKYYDIPAIRSPDQMKAADLFALFCCYVDA